MHLAGLNVLHMILVNGFSQLFFRPPALLKLAGRNYAHYNQKRLNLRRRSHRTLRGRESPCREQTYQGNLQCCKSPCREQNYRSSNMTSSSSTERTTERLLETERSGRILYYFFESASNVFKADELGQEIAIITFPAFLALAVDPLASLVDTAFIGQIGSVELAAVGVSIAVFNFISKLLNFPVLNITTSFVAVEDSIEPELKGLELDLSTVDVIADEERDQLQDGNENATVTDVDEGGRQNFGRQIPAFGQRNLPAVSTALVLGSIVGLAEACVLAWGAGPILEIMGVPSDSNMRVPAEQYLTLRAIGSPAVVLSLAVQGVFRGFKDTKFPLYATLSGNIANIILDPLLMFSLQLGVSGAAIATVVSQYFIALVLLWKLNQKVVLLPPKLGDLEFSHFLKTGGLLLARSSAVMICMTLATSQAARQGPILTAAHQICLQVWLAASLLSDAIALAGQTIIATALAKGDYALAKHAAFRTLQMGFAFGFVLSLILGAGLHSLSRLFTSDPSVLEILAVGIPFVAATQPVNALAFVFDGILFGASDFVYAAYSMIIVAFLASLFMLLFTPLWGFVGIWSGLTILMTFRMLAGFLRIGTTSGPWKFLN